MFALKTLRPETGAPVFFALRPIAGGALALALAVTLSACSKPAPKADEVRPVRAIVLSSSNVDVNAEFAGEVVPRVVSQLGFRVGGKIVARKVDVGTVVKRGQVLMQLDPQDLQLSQAQAKAALASAETNRDLARAELKRYQDLREKNFVSQTVLDSKDATYKAAQSNVDAAQAAYRGQANQSGYASLLADVDGVVTRIDAEAGQVVAAGTPVVQVARSGDKEVAIGLPEDKVETMRGVKDVVVRLWADPTQALAGKIREISPVADPATRTYQAKVTIPDVPQARLGMTAVVQFVSQTATPQIRVPLTALFNEKSQSSVWVVENGAVQRVAVTVGGVAGNDLLLTAGVKAGQTVVTAGANLLKPGQKVSILGTGLAPMAGSAASAGAAK
ncbi:MULTISPECIES: efflux RND transporter periplasmic adaptor subunit [unclassified Janthinobacterium]|uniref:efflux RND transporter periplasmic adaptor subunit n=1 Tax=unclassified Janthinobacterium TaxID=2610881 RepID=UPI0016220CE1|nr:MULTISPECIES: efflux RND transporter periplasmic adaptor subunit [unclassified Janthinobacterium]MBB5369895.1 RND family efflux transporter MFP subunit [Janthinobacterium sp. K2C7]MBB5382701.1 RND family efflux transporter MFP subunit [Janthinobacterium sp. K2Li3]MBB5384686.1 RND family efflux transporter MFP subunit [Janthinobacterium sp. K2E3]